MVREVGGLTDVLGVQERVVSSWRGESPPVFIASLVVWEKHLGIRTFRRDVVEREEGHLVTGESLLLKRRLGVSTGEDRGVGCCEEF